jgi:adenosine deaminase
MSIHEEGHPDRSPAEERSRNELDLRALPKVELHRHLEGAIRLSTIIDLSREAGVPLPADTPEDLAHYALIRQPVRDLEEALATFAIAQNSIRSYEAVRRISFEAVEDLAAENVRLAELRFSPEFMCAPGELDWDGAMEAVLHGVGAAAAGRDVGIGLVAIFSRDFGLGSAERTVAFALRHRDELVGFDVAGTEIGYRPGIYAEVLAPVRDAGLPLTVHYGESGGPEYPKEAIEALGPARLGHGLSVARDPAVIELVIERGVTLEMCPTSNVLTRGVARPEDHPAGRLLAKGVKVTINTDDPGLMGIDLTHELEVARDALGFSIDDLRAVTSNAIEASFVPDDLKTGLRARHFGWVEG